MKLRAVFGSTALTLALLAQSAYADDVPVSDSARTHFKTGVAYMQDPDGARYEEAYHEFKAAYADSPSWKILGNLGITSMKLERDGEAIDAYEKYIAQGGSQIDASEKAQVERDLLTTKAGVVSVSVKVTPAAGVTLTDERQPLAGRPVTNRYDVGQDGTLQVGIRRGRHKVTASIDGYLDQVWEFDAEPGKAQTHEFVLQPTPAAQPAVGQPVGVGVTTPPEAEMKRPISTPVIIAAAATGAFLIGTGVVGGLALSKGSDYKSKNDGLHVAEAKSAHDSAQTLNIVGDSLLGATVVGAVVTTILFLNRPYVAAGTPADAGPTARRIDVMPAVGMNSGGVMMTGQF
ncbi:MAG TPA: hypothetical protein VH062_13730 [Polyangiaceae bacterium]|jgi:hypothetical protein|nr:hypothetical protein [Polyangiaceae bacterium]